MRNILLIILLVCAAGCATAKGIGEDIGTVGDWTEKASDSVRTAGQ